jgi:D-alanyl-D-alanine endopeptidase (penicillin-binding protein 7)
MVKFFRQTLFVFAAAILPATYAIAATTPHKKHATYKTSSVKSESGKFVKRTIMVNGKRRVVVQRVVVASAAVAHPSVGDMAGLKHSQDPLYLQSNVAYVVDQSSSKVLFEKNSNVSLPIASITKLMTSLVVVEANQDMNELIEVTTDDLDKEKGTGSRLKMGAKLSRADMLHIALMSSENRAASALGRSYVGGLPAFVLAMNAKAKQLGMTDTHYVDSSGLSSQNVASARDLVKLINAAYRHPLIREYSTDAKYVVNPSGRPLQYSTTNKLVANPDWDIGLQKTGYISEAGRCLVMQAMIEGRAVVMVFLDSKGKYSRLADAGRIRKWLETIKPQA